MSEKENNNATILISLLVGGIVGAGLALLFAPTSGKRLRGRITEAAEDLKEEASDLAGRIKRRVS